MSKENILIPVDFSGASDCAVRTAQRIAEITKSELTLLHILNGITEQEAESQIRSVSDSVTQNGSFRVNTVISHGNPIQEISRYGSDDSYSMMVIGTHGYKGLREKLLGADILKLLKNIPVPVFVVQNEYTFPKDGIKKILFPTSTHNSFPVKIKATVRLAQLFDAEVHLYTIEKPGLEISESMIDNISLAKREFESAGITYHRIKDKQESYSVGYAKQILTYAANSQIDVISLITSSTRENYYFADSDKISILTNTAKIPVLCTSDKTIKSE